MCEGRAEISHLERLLRVLKNLQPRGISLYEHQYHPVAFGSFVAVLGHARKRVKFSWDGREFMLSVSFANFPTKNARANWIHHADISLPNGKGLYQDIALNTADLLAILPSNQQPEPKRR
jgi:hypothetical protein